MKRVEGVEKFLLHRLFSCDKLNIVDHQKIHVAVPLPKLHVFTGADRFDHIVREHFAGHVHDARGGICFLHGVTDRMHQMRLAQAHAAVQEQRIIRHARRLDDRKRRRVRKVVGLADHKRIERVFRIQRQRIHVRRFQNKDPVL